ncbi:hypothetical protein Tco_0967232 [Tanacetum coccineum]
MIERWRKICLGRSKASEDTMKLKGSARASAVWLSGIIGYIVLDATKFGAYQLDVVRVFLFIERAAKRVSIEEIIVNEKFEECEMRDGRGERVGERERSIEDGSLSCDCEEVGDDGEGVRSCGGEGRIVRMGS